MLKILVEREFHADFGLSNTQLNITYPVFFRAPISTRDSVDHSFGLFIPYLGVCVHNKCEYFGPAVDRPINDDDGAGAILSYLLFLSCVESAPSLRVLSCVGGLLVAVAARAPRQSLMHVIVNVQSRCRKCDYT